MLDFEKIFLGHTPGEQRRYMLHVLRKVRDREKMPNGMYKIVYVTDFYDRSYGDCVRIFLNELEARTR